MGNENAKRASKPPETPPASPRNVELRHRKPQPQPQSAMAVAQLQIVPTIAQMPRSRDLEYQKPKLAVVRNNSSYNWANRYYRLLSETEPFEESKTEEDKARYNSIVQAMREQNFVYTRKPLRFPKNVISHGNPLIGYKTVAIMDINGEYIKEVVALIQIQVGLNIAFGETGKKIETANELKSGQKLCTNKTTVNAVQFVGPIGLVQKYGNMYVNNVIELVSQFDSHFKYKLGESIIETSFGEPGIGCIQGIHFFLTKDQAIQYLKCGFTGLNLTGSMITSQITEKKVEDREKVSPRDNDIAGRFARIRRISSAETVGDTTYLIENEQQPHPNCFICKKERCSLVSTCGHSFHIDCMKDHNLIMNICPICDSSLR